MMFLIILGAIVAVSAAQSNSSAPVCKSKLQLDIEKLEEEHPFLKGL